MMTTILEKITIYSENGDRDYPATLEISMNGKKPDCPVTFWWDGKPVFSLGADEIHQFCEELEKMDCTA